MRRLAILEVSIYDLHDAPAELHDADLRRLLHLAHSVEQAVGWHASVGIDNEDVVADANIAIRPSAAMLFDDFGEATLVRPRLVARDQPACRWMWESFSSVLQLSMRPKLMFEAYDCASAW